VAEPIPRPFVASRQCMLGTSLHALIRRGGAFNSCSLRFYKFLHYSHSSATSGSRKFRFRQRYFCCAVGAFVVAGYTSSPLKDNSEDMAPLDLPGRPNNLTDEQKIKLKEMWIAAFKVFGVRLDSESETATTPTEPLPSEPSEDISRATLETDDLQKKKGGKIKSLFKKKTDQSEPSASMSAIPSASNTDLSKDVSKLGISDNDKHLQTKGYKDLLATSTPQEIQDTFWKMVKTDHPDSLFLRFLRARKWDVPKAIVMFVATLRWRSKEIDVPRLFVDVIDLRRLKIL